ncbi:MAG: dihydropteroate synthase [Muribaculaceae bacterium]|nr:dihydropteroate synthase [Muribaculaceae bacterium]
MIDYTPYSIKLSGKLIELNTPRVMGILNVTPDSFYSRSRYMERDAIFRRVEQIIEEGGEIIDIGGYSSRPGASEVSASEELERVAEAFAITRSIAPDMPVSIDTFRSVIVKECNKSFGDFIVNDISGGNLDSKMFETVAQLDLPYILMHMRGTPQNMQSLTDYGSAGILTDIISDMANKVSQLNMLGVNDIIIDPGFGFSKTTEQNYFLMSHLEEFHILQLPLLVGISRKSMIYKVLETTPDNSLTGTTVLHTTALNKGVHIIRAHDVKEACECIKICQSLYKNYTI